MTTFVIGVVVNLVVHVVHGWTVDRDAFRRRLGARVRKARIAKELSQAELAEKMELSRPAIASIEAGRQGLMVEQLMLLAHLLDVAAEQLLREDGPVKSGEVHRASDADPVGRWKARFRKKEAE